MRQTLLIAVMIGLATLSAMAQTNRRTSTRQAIATAGQTKQLTVQQKIVRPIENIRLERATAKQAFEWWSQITGIPLVISWESMENDGIDREAPVTLKLKRAPAEIVLKLIMQMTSQDVSLIHEITPWYVQVMTKFQANRKTVRRTYDINDLITQIPSFTSAPSFDLSSALEGGGETSGGGTTNIFGGTNEDSDEGTTRRERGEAIADIIRETIEPDIWIANGGLHSSITYFNGMLIVKAPMYVQRQIGPSYGQTNARRRVSITQSRKSNVGGGYERLPPRSRNTSVSGVQSEAGATAVSGKAKN